MFEEKGEILDRLILDGIVEPSGVDSETGEILFAFTPKIKDEHPKMYEEMMKIFYEDIHYLWQHGFLNMDVSMENPVVSITEKAFDKDEVSKLPAPVRIQLVTIMDALSLD